MWCMEPIKSIRKFVFGLNQTDFGERLGRRQSIVSRWESGRLLLNQEDMTAIRDLATAEGKPWNDRWFFEGCPNGEK